MLRHRGVGAVSVPQEVIDRLRQGMIPVIAAHYNGWLDEDNRTKAFRKTREIGQAAARRATTRSADAMAISDFDEGVVETLVERPTPWCREFANYLGLQLSEGV